MTRADLLVRVSAERRPGEGLYSALVGMGVDLRHLVCTPGDPWELSSQLEVEGWIDRHVVWDEDGHLLRVLTR